MCLIHNSPLQLDNSLAQSLKGIFKKLKTRSLQVHSFLPTELHYASYLVPLIPRSGFDYFDMTTTCGTNQLQSIH